MNFWLVYSNRIEFDLYRWKIRRYNKISSFIMISVIIIVIFQGQPNVLAVL